MAHLTAVGPVVPPVEEPAVVINGQNYTEAQAEEALLGLKAGDVVEIRTNGTIAKEYTFVAANYTLGEGAVLTIQANAVAPAGAKLTVGSKSVIVVESGATIDISALTQDDFATSTEARLEIANGATVIMPAYTEALWNDAYLKVVIEAMVADSEVGAKLVLGETKLTKTASGWEAEAPVLEDVAVNVTELAAVQLAANTELVAGSGIYTTTPSKDDGSKLVIDSSKKSIDGFDFTLRLKFGGTMKVSDGVVTDGLKLEVKGAATITVYAMSSSSGSDRVLHLATLADNAFTTVGEQTALGASIAKLTYEVSAAGTYYLGSTNSGINVYYVAINYVAPAHTCESVCPECGKCLDAACTESACAEKCEGHAPATVTANIDLVSSFKSYASAWDSSYTERTIDLAAVSTLEGTLVLSRANKQSGTITDRPVIAGKNSTVYATLTLNSNITSVTFDLKQWTTKTFTDIHIEYYDEATSTWVSCSASITTPAAISSTAIPAGVTQVRLSIKTTNSSNTQLGLTGIEVVYEG